MGDEIFGARPDEAPACSLYRDFLAVKRLGCGGDQRGVDRLPLLGPRVRIAGAIPPLSPPPSPSVPARKSWGDLYLIYYKMRIVLFMFKYTPSPYHWLFLLLLTCTVL